MEIDVRLRQLLAERGATIPRIAEKIGEPRGSVDRWFSGKNRPNISSLIKLANFFDVSLDVLVGRESRVADLTEDERYVIGMFRDLGLSRQAVARAFAKAAQETEPPQPARAPMGPLQPTNDPELPAKERSRKRG